MKVSETLVNVGVDYLAGSGFVTCANFEDGFRKIMVAELDILKAQFNDWKTTQQKVSSKMDYNIQNIGKKALKTENKLNMIVI